MRFAFAILLACGCVDLSDPPGWTEAADHINASPACIATTDPSGCETTRQAWQQTYMDALSGKQTAQQRVALCLSTGCGGAIRKDPVLACAWDLALKAGEPTNSEPDTINETADCHAALLGSGGLAAATAKADALRSQMRNRT
jgi:hypothetical protein